jgi:L-alanine-DL-glutamate epimerase-like enolase superfamily enzyme
MRPDRDVLQFDPALSYGLVEYLRTIEMLERHRWSRRRLIPHGGHLFAVHIALGLGTGGNESYPGVFEPFGGFPESIRVEDGHVRLPDAPGIGYEAKADLFAVLRSVAE